MNDRDKLEGVRVGNKIENYYAGVVEWYTRTIEVRIP